MRFLPFVGSKRFSRDVIISILSKEWPLSLKELVRRVNKESTNPISYQGIHKIVLQLEQSNVLVKRAGKYQISLEYIQALIKQGKELEKAYAISKKVTPSKSKEMIFNTIIEFGRFIIFDFLNYSVSNKLPTICHWHNAYSLIGLSKHEIKELEKSMTEKTFYVLIHGNSLVDKLLAATYQKMGAHVKLGIPCAFQSDLFVVGHHVMEAYFDFDLKKRWKHVWSKPTKVNEFDLSQTLDEMFGKNPIRVIVYENAAIAQQIRDQTLAEFNKEKNEKFRLK